MGYRAVRDGEQENAAALSEGGKGVKSKIHVLL
jgi:hypothetical protein